MSIQLQVRMGSVKVSCEQGGEVKVSCEQGGEGCIELTEWSVINGVYNTVKKKH